LKSEFDKTYADAWGWLSWPAEPINRWVEYFQDMISIKKGNEQDGIYVTIGSKTDGRIQNSGIGRLIRWDIILSTFADKLDCEEAKDDQRSSKDKDDQMSSKDKDAVLNIHKDFYDALAKDDASAVVALFKAYDSTMMESATKQEPGPITGKFKKDGVLDSWQTVMGSDYLWRPQNLKTTDPVCVVQGDRAWVTCLETAAEGSAKLVTQRFLKKDDEWMLVGHRTVPYGTLVKPTLDKLTLCDASGCMTLPRLQSSTYSRSAVSSVDNFKLT